jgi:hypothetical protein
VLVLVVAVVEVAVGAVVLLFVVVSVLFVLISVSFMVVSVLLVLISVSFVVFSIMSEVVSVTVKLYGYKSSTFLTDSLRETVKNCRCPKSQQVQSVECSNVAAVCCCAGLMIERTQRAALERRG